MALTKEIITESINVFGEYKSIQIAEDTVVKSTILNLVVAVLI